MHCGNQPSYLSIIPSSLRWNFRMLQKHYSFSCCQNWPRRIFFFKYFQRRTSPRTSARRPRAFSNVRRWRTHPNARTPPRPPRREEGPPRPLPPPSWPSSALSSSSPWSWRGPDSCGSLTSASVPGPASSAHSGPRSAGPDAERARTRWVEIKLTISHLYSSQKGLLLKSTHPNLRF